MPASSRRVLIFIFWLILAGVGGIGLVWFFGKSDNPGPVASSQPSSAPTTVAAATEPEPVVKKTLQNYGQVLHADLLHYPATQPWMAGVDLVDAAHILLPERVYVCPAGQMWITRGDADPLPAVLTRAPDEYEHVIDRPISFVQWTVSKKGERQAAVVCAKSDGGWELDSATSSLPIPNQSYHWEWAQSWFDNGENRIIVPTDGGVSMLTVGKEITETHCKLYDGPDAGPRAMVLFDTRGVLAWCPKEDGVSGTCHTARFVDGQWKMLDGDDWPTTIIQLSPKKDGSVLQVRHGAEAGSATLAIVALDEVPIDEAKVKSLVDLLSDDDPNKRAAAMADLTEYGPGVFPMLERMQGDALPEGQARIHELLQGRLVTQLGGMLINDNKMSVFRRLRDGGVIFYCPEGVSIPQGKDDPRVVKPDYLAARPGSPVLEVPADLVALLTPGADLEAIHDEWMLTSADKGPQRYLPPDLLIPLLRESERSFTKLMAIDFRGRWIFKEDAAAATEPSSGPTTNPSVERTLIIDPTVPDPSPRLAIWQVDIATDVGWTKDNWPAIKHGNDHWRLNSRGWEVMAEGEEMITSLSVPAPASTEPSTNPMASNIASTQPTGGEEDGSWRVADLSGHMFVVKPQGGIVRMGREMNSTTQSSSGELTLEATFKKRVPYFREIRRVWLDPAGRIVVAYGSDRIAFIFPTGQLPPELADQVLPQDLIRVDPVVER